MAYERGICPAKLFCFVPFLKERDTKNLNI